MSRSIDNRRVRMHDAQKVACPERCSSISSAELTGRRTQAAQTRDRLKMNGDEVRRELAQLLNILEDCDHLYAAGNPALKRDLSGTLFQKIRTGREIRETEGIFTDEFR